MIREIVTIDEELCDGCSLCVPACHEGALRIVNGKARLLSDRYCDGLGACLGHCPRGAIKIERRNADAFDETAVAARFEVVSVSPSGDGCPGSRPAAFPEVAPLACGCPGSRLMTFGERAPAIEDATTDSASTCPRQRSELTHWPVQLRLLPPNAPILRGARLVVAADCVPVAYPDFHARLLRGRAVVIGCPKFDDLEGYVEKLTEMIRANGLREIVVARMEVPCCTGIVYAVQEARRRANVEIQITEVVIGTRGDVLVERDLPVQAVA
jgi:Pyruvate/2-oxoacid:ferredoxin oxidoreductase delta subunit